MIDRLKRALMLAAEARVDVTDGEVREILARLKVQDPEIFNREMRALSLDLLREQTRMQTPPVVLAGKRVGIPLFFGDPAPKRRWWKRWGA